MNKRLQIQKTRHTKAAHFPEALTPIPVDSFPPVAVLPDAAWVSRKYMVQLFHVQNSEYPGLIRLSICRAKQKLGGVWQDGISWDELQAIKRELGYGDWYGVEVFPPDDEIVNVANFRHLWLLPEPLSIGWFKGK